MPTTRLFRTVFAFFILSALSFGSPTSVDSKYKLIFFEGSDWCVNCIRFEKNVLSDPYVVRYMDKQDITIERIDFPQRKELEPKQQEYNAKVAEKYDFQGIFPTIILVNNSTAEVTQLEYHDQDAIAFVSQLKSNL